MSEKDDEYCEYKDLAGSLVGCFWDIGKFKELSLKIAKIDEKHPDFPKRYLDEMQGKAVAEIRND